MTAVGKNIPHDSAVGHVTGTSEYVPDIIKVENELVVDFFYSVEPHGQVLKIDLEEARKIPGIVGLYTYKDISGKNKFGPIIKDEVLLAEDIVEYFGQPIVIIAAESKQAIKLAKKAIKVEIKKLTPVFSIEEAIEKEQFIGQMHVIERGNIEEEFLKGENILEGTTRNGGQEHFYLESQSAIAYPGENDTVEIISSTQNPTEVQNVVGEILDIPFNKVVVKTRRMGGAFGGKETQATHPAAMVALVAVKTKRPCRICLSCDDDMKTTGKRHEFFNRYKVAFTKEGLITALRVELFSNGGYANDLSTSVMDRAIFHAENAYYIPNIKIVGRVCKTNLPPNTAFRGFGGPQGMLNIESIIEDIAVFLKKDAFDVRRLNCYETEKHNVTPYGQEIPNNTLPELIEKLFNTSDYKARRKQVEEYNKNSILYLKGISFTLVKFGISFTARFMNQASALVNVYTDGSIQVSTGGTEMGQGLNTKISQIVADEFCVDQNSVRMMITSTEKNNNTSPTAASASTDLNGTAARNACQVLKNRLIEFASSFLTENNDKYKPSIDHVQWTEEGIWDIRIPDKKISFKDLVKNAHTNRISLGERGFYATPQITQFNWDKGRGNPFLYYTNGCAVSEVKIDRFTGELKVLRTDILMDIGKPINPGIDRGQIIGGFIQGMGWLTTEELMYSDKGELLSHSPTTYKIPNIQDVPDILNVDWIPNDKNIMNIRQSKAVGEPPLMTAISVWTAIKHALSFSTDGKIPKLNAPATSEEILKALSSSQAPVLTKV